jgi:hypothetical protein
VKWCVGTKNTIDLSDSSAFISWIINCLNHLSDSQIFPDAFNIDEEAFSVEAALGFVGHTYDQCPINLDSTFPPAIPAKKKKKKKK